MHSVLLLRENVELCLRLRARKSRREAACKQQPHGFFLGEEPAPAECCRIRQPNLAGSDPSGSAVRNYSDDDGWATVDTHHTANHMRVRAKSSFPQGLAD